MSLSLNNLSPAIGSKPSAKRLGRGIGSGLGKTSGRGHKGQKSRKGGGIRRGFEGGQMPLYRRLPKFGFTSHINNVAEVRLSDLEKVPSSEITLDILKEFKVVAYNFSAAKVILSGEITAAKAVKGIKVTKGAKSAIEAAGGSVEE